MALLRRFADESIDEYYERLREKSDREDVVMFVNACFAATRQNEFYDDRSKQAVSIDFLHRYLMANYRRMYARSIAAGVNHFNQSKIVFNLLAAGAPSCPDQRAEEGELIAASLRGLPANRAYGLLSRLQKARINNRRTRAVIRRYLQWRREPAFDAIKYRNKYKAVAAHAHVRLEHELGPFLFELKPRRKYQTELLDKYRQAHYSAAAIYELPFTVAESLAQKHGVPREKFFKKIEHKMTAAEKLRFQSTVSRTKDAKIAFNLARAPLTKLAIYIFSLSISERRERAEEIDAALTRSAKRASSGSPSVPGKVAAILDFSRSSAGSRQKRNRPIAVAIGASYFLRNIANEYREFLTPAIESSNGADYIFLRDPAGQTSLADSMIDAFEWNPDLIVIVSDGYENDPPGAACQVAEVYGNKIGKRRTPEIIHLNPVFDSDHFAPRPLGKAIATVGVRDAEDISTMLGFARFASGAATLDELEHYLSLRMTNMLDSNSKQ